MELSSCFLVVCSLAFGLMILVKVLLEWKSTLTPQLSSDAGHRAF